MYLLFELLLFMFVESSLTANPQNYADGQRDRWIPDGLDNKENEILIEFLEKLLKVGSEPSNGPLSSSVDRDIAAMIDELRRRVQGPTDRRRVEFTNQLLERV
ncbi:hypothetical protein QR680_016355 [Steinernema hermaphroditum]|uniref:Uncharacterized protein n=1 Tax=Steinernema hermaphroditum TaxID=289476 RepID=A0AA39HCY4_9BILA|nr:hypothetical protein QR680_016355 [Steinernema hermaphroditum]